MWLPVDCTEGSGSQVQMGFQRHFSPDYFAPAPEHLALTHLPSDPSWQLLQEPLSLQELRPLISPDIDVLGSGGIRPQDWSESIHVDAGAQSPVAQVCIHAESDVVFSADLQKVSQHQATPAGVHGLSNSPLSLDRSGMCLLLCLMLAIMFLRSTPRGSKKSTKTHRCASRMFCSVTQQPMPRWVTHWFSQKPKPTPLPLSYSTGDSIGGLMFVSARRER